MVREGFHSSGEGKGQEALSMPSLRYFGRLFVACLAFWFPNTAMVLETLLWFQWIGFTLLKNRPKHWRHLIS